MVERRRAALSSPPLGKSSAALLYCPSRRVLLFPSTHSQLRARSTHAPSRIVCFGRAPFALLLPLSASSAAHPEPCTQRVVRLPWVVEPHPSLPVCSLRSRTLSPRSHFSASHSAPSSLFPLPPHGSGECALTFLFLWPRCRRCGRDRARPPPPCGEGNPTGKQPDSLTHVLTIRCFFAFVSTVHCDLFDGRPALIAFAYGAYVHRLSLDEDLVSAYRLCHTHTKSETRESSYWRMYTFYRERAVGGELMGFTAQQNLDGFPRLAMAAFPSRRTRFTSSCCSFHSVSPHLPSCRSVRFFRLAFSNSPRNDG